MTNKKGREKMKIELVGTGSIGAIQSCSSTLIDDKLLIDMGNGTIKKLKHTGHLIKDLENCLITHLHGDHFGDIPFFMLDRFMYKIETPVHIYEPKGMKKTVRELFDILFPGDYETVQEIAKVDFIEFEEMKYVNIGEETYITSYEVQHGKIKPAYGFIVEKQNKKIGFSGDSCYCEAIDTIVKQSDLSVLDMSWMESKKAHMGLEDILKITQNYPNKKIVTTHMQDYTREQAKKQNIENLLVLDDGEIIEL